MGLAIPEDEREHFEDLLGSGGIFRRLVKRTEGAQAEFGEEVTVRYSERLLESDKLIADDQVRQFRIGDGEVMPALELSAKMMRVGEAQEVRCEARFAYGDKGRLPDVPANAPLKLFVELLRVGKRLTAEMTSAELLVEATKKKESGNRYFKEENYDQAAKLYKRALKILESWERDEAKEGEEEQESEEAKQCKALLVALGNNVANVQHKLKQHKEARQSSLEVLQIDADNVKAMYRVAQLALDENDFDEATAFLKRAIALEPNTVKFRDMVGKVKAKKEAHRAREKELYSKLAPPKAPAASQDPHHQQQEQEQQLSPARQFLRNNISIISTVLTGIIALLMFHFIGKPYHGL